MAQVLKETVPATMRSLVAPTPCAPAGYEVVEMPTPTITKPNHVLLRMHSASMNTGDTQWASGKASVHQKLTLRLSLSSTRFPLKIGISGSGVVVAVGPDVKDLKVGDAVYGFHMDKPMVDFSDMGTASDYALAEERLVVRKPEHVSFEDAAAFPAQVVTAYQALRRALQIRGLDSLEGRTVFVPGALSGNGSAAIQVARNVYGASRVVSTASTAKMGLVAERLPAGAVDELFDYQRQDVRRLVAGLGADVAINTQWGSLDECFAAVGRRRGVVVSLASAPTKATLETVLGPGRVPFWLGWILGLAQLWYGWKLLGTGIHHEFLSGSTNIREDLEKMGEIVARGQVKAVTTVVDLDDIDAVREACGRVATSKGGIGKVVIRIA